MRAVFLNQKHEVGEVYSYFFEVPDDFKWVAGQYINYTLDGIPPSGAERLFTIASAPHEEYLQITTIAGPSDFKVRLRSLKKGDEVEIDQLGGDFIWQDDNRDKLYLAGGIGITPFRAIVLDRFHNKLSNHAVLMYAGRPGHRPFLNELQNVANQDPSFKKLDYGTKRISVDEIAKVIPDYKNRTIYIAGPQPFVEGLGEALADDGISKSQIKYDWFDGYHHDV